MLRLPTSILRVRRTESATRLEWLEPESKRLAAVARFETPNPGQPSRFQTWRQALLAKHRRLGAILGVVFLLVFLPVFLLGHLIRGKHSIRERPRLRFKDADDGAILLMIEQSSGMFYDSRIVLDGEGRAIAQLRGPSKIALGRMTFGIIDLGGNNREAKDYAVLPWLGAVVPSEPGVYHVSLVGLKDAGRIVEEHRDDDEPGEISRYLIKARPELEGHRNGMTLLLAAALAIAWRPPP